jgi:hypothetical protein
VTQRKTSDPTGKPSPPAPGEAKQTNEPWKQPVEKEQDPGTVTTEHLDVGNEQARIE